VPLRKEAVMETACAKTLLRKSSIQWSCIFSLSLSTGFAVLLATVACASDHDLLSGLEPTERQFQEYEVGDKVVYFYQRMLDGAIVEKDFISYQFDGKTGTLLAKKQHWHEDVPEHLPEIQVTREQAQAKIGGEIESARLFILSPQSAVFPIRPVPENPCWVVRSIAAGQVTLTVIDAVTGDLLGHGVPPPYDAYSFAGPASCIYGWNYTAWSEHAASWFNTMGYDTDIDSLPTYDEVKAHVRSDSTALFYELAHGGWSGIEINCEGGCSLLWAFRVGLWMNRRAKMPFAFIGSCSGLCKTGPGTFSYEFRKGSVENTVTVGYCFGDVCLTCWEWSIEWQTALFDYMSQGWTVKAAFDQAMADYPMCAADSCVRFLGDETFKVVPPVKRDPEAPDVAVTSPNGGEVIMYGDQYEIRWAATDNARVTSIAILVSTDGGTSWPDTIAADEANDSSYVWEVPDLSSDMGRIKVVAVDGAENHGFDVSDADFTLWGTTAGIPVPAHPGVPEAQELAILGSNPVRAVAQILYGIPRDSWVKLAIYDVRGRLVASLVDGYMQAGYYSLDWDGSRQSGGDHGSGIYFLRLECDHGQATAKILMAR
jgi:hypothetical protein